MVRNVPCAPGTRSADFYLDLDGTENGGREPLRRAQNTGTFIIATASVVVVALIFYVITMVVITAPTRCVYINKYIYIYIHIHTYTYTYIHACMHAYIHTCIQTNNKYVHTHIHIYIYTYIRIDIYTFIHTYMCMLLGSVLLCCQSNYTA